MGRWHLINVFVEGRVGLRMASRGGRGRSTTDFDSIKAALDVRNPYSTTPRKKELYVLPPKYSKRPRGVSKSSPDLGSLEWQSAAAWKEAEDKTRKEQIARRREAERRITRAIAKRRSEAAKKRLERRKEGK